MMFEADALEFPAFAGLPKREKSKLHKVWDAFQELSRVTEEKGLLVQQSIAARLLDVSPQRVNELVKAGRLETHNFNGVPLVTENSIVSFAKSERKSGRPCNLPTTLSESFRRAKQK
jgi:hypothetical protein